MYGDIINKANGDYSIEAVHRRWIFIRFFESWNLSHINIYNNDMKTIKREYGEIYQGKNTEYEMMNALVGLGLLFYQHKFALPPYITKYYSDTLIKLSKTLFG